ncbi:Protein PXR1 [Yarrowia sp. E02]|nr:Protein PXR1 [Yarrowia sp. E02]
MGLAGVSKKIKYGKDPRNLGWSNNTERFGHKHMSKLGWKDGEGLGHEDRKAQSITQNIKIVLKDDNVGLGASLAKAGKDEAFGLMDFQKLLGKLNGRAQEIEAEVERQQKDVLRGKFGMVFVSGGLLQGTIEEFNKKRGSEAVEESDSDSEESDSESEDEKKSKKSSKKDKKEKKDKKSKKRKADDSDDEEKKSKKSKKDKKEKKEKKDKKEKKEKKDKKDKKDKKSASPTPHDGMEKPSASSTSALRGRMAGRAKFIRSKRMAVMDEKSLNEIFMVKN